jgi:drug/metabolite transporter (DMT)-like permease
LVSADAVRSVRSVTSRHPILFVWFGTLMFSTGPVIIAASSAAAGVFAFYRLWIGAALLGLLAYGRHRRAADGGGALVTSAGLKWTALAGVAFAVHQLLFIVAIQRTSVVDVTLMNTLAPVVVAVLAVPLFGERPGVSFRVWSVVAITGAMVVAVAGSSGPQGNPLSMGLAAGNVVAYAVFFVWSKRGRDHIDPMVFLAGATFVAAVVSSAYAVAVSADLGALSGHDLVLVIVVAAVPGLLGHLAITWSLKWVPANLPPVIMLAIPVLSGLLAWQLLHQGVAPLKLVGGVITIAGVAGAVWSPGARDLAREALDLAEGS